jgi:hypothetical protein
MPATFLRSNKDLCEGCRGINYESLISPSGYRHTFLEQKLRAQYDAATSSHLPDCAFCAMIVKDIVRIEKRYERLSEVFLCFHHDSTGSTRVGVKNDDFYKNSSKSVTTPGEHPGAQTNVFIKNMIGSSLPIFYRMNLLI